MTYLLIWLWLSAILASVADFNKSTKATGFSFFASAIVIGLIGPLLIPALFFGTVFKSAAGE